MNRLGFLAALTALVVTVVVILGTGGGGGTSGPATTGTETGAGTQGSTTTAATSSCTATVSIGLLAPLSGDFAAMGADQLHWARFFVADWNTSHTPKLRIVPADTEHDPDKAATLAQQFAGDGSILGVIGPAGADEVESAASALRTAGLGFISPSATRASLAGGADKGYFFRVVPNEMAQAPVDVAFMTKHLGVGAGTGVLVVSDGASASSRLAGAVEAGLKAHGAAVSHVSVSRGATDFSAAIGAIGSGTKVAFLALGSPAQAQLFAEQLRAAGKQAVVFGSDGTFDPAAFSANGSYVSYATPEAESYAADSATGEQFQARYHDKTTAFGVASYVAAQIWAAAIHQACVNGSLSRESARALLPTTSLSTSLLGTPVEFAGAGELKAARFHVLKLVHGSLVTVQ